MRGSLFLQATPYVIAASFLAIAFLHWRLKSTGFQMISWKAIVIASGMSWGVFAAVLISSAWDSYYRYFMPGWYRYLAPVAAVVLYPALGLLFHRAAMHLPGSPILWFCFLGGVESIPEHAVAIYRFEILQIPLLVGAHAAAVFLFAFFEYMFYWSVVLALAAVFSGLLRLSSQLVRSSQPDR